MLPPSNTADGRPLMLSHFMVVVIQLSKHFISILKCGTPALLHILFIITQTYYAQQWVFIHFHVTFKSEFYGMQAVERMAKVK